MDLDLVYKATAAITSPPSNVPPESLATSAITSNSFTLSWTKPACDGIGHIQVYEITLDPPRAAGVVTVNVDNPFQQNYVTSITGLAECTSYTVKITAGNAGWYSGESSVAVKTTCQNTAQRFSLLTGTRARNTAAVRTPLPWRWVGCWWLATLLLSTSMQTAAKQ
jgi:hypothetical protein